MPRIAASSVREHRARMLATLIDAADDILSHGGTLTAGSVAAAAGIARNSLYRYVDSVDDLRILVANRHLPEWNTQIAEAVDAADTPADKVAAYVTANLREAAPGGRTWVMRMAQAIDDRDGLDPAHAAITAGIEHQVRATGVEPTALMVGIVRGVLQAGFERLDAGDPADQVIEGARRAVVAVLTPAPAPAVPAPSPAVPAAPGSPASPPSV